MIRNIGHGGCYALYFMHRPVQSEYVAMVKDNPYTDNKELLIIPNAVHTGGRLFRNTLQSSEGVSLLFTPTPK
ncbi:MAG: hypothetical protein K2N73_18130 [Lachnospiraceae bacterium]|nr:hypothetical protein [Lachnospiraceae bacterium]